MICESTSPISVSPRHDDFAIAMITAPRPQPTVAQSFRELRRAGFTQIIRLFAEPQSALPDDASLRIRQNGQRVGCWRNWLTAVQHLLHESEAPFLLICEDDIALARCAAPALYHAMNTLPLHDWGYLSLYTPKQNIFGHEIRNGWQSIALRTFAWGALAYVFTRDSLSALLHHKDVLLHPGDRETDTIVSRTMTNLGRKTYYHIPSLCRHTGGDNSSLNHCNLPGMEAVGFDADFSGYVSRQDKNTEAHS